VTDERTELVREAMHSTGTSQSELARLSGVHQSSVSQFLAGKTPMSDEQVGRLLSCMGFRLEVVRRLVSPHLTRSERRSWRLHRQVARRLSQDSLTAWRPMLEKNLSRLGDAVQGQPHVRNLMRWRRRIESGDVLGLHRVLTGLDRDSIEMREVSPMSGVLSEDERLAALGLVT
jgi:transcriptional regulator with XRE-family HTH domain